MSVQEELIPRAKAKAKKLPPLSEGQLVALLCKRFEEDAGNGAKGAVIPQVRDAASWDAARTIDALGVSFWKSQGLTLDAFECKSSRSDLMRELDAPAKSDRFCQLCDRFTIVLGRADLCAVEELPPSWGLLVPRGEGDKAKLRQVRAPQMQHEGTSSRGVAPLPPGFDRSFLIALIRSTHRVSTTEDADLSRARNEGFAAGAEHGEQKVGRELVRLRARSVELEAFERGLGIRVTQWRSVLLDDSKTPEEIGALFKAVLGGEQDVTALRNRMSSAAKTAEQLAEQARAQVDKLDRLLAAGPSDGEAA